MAIRDGIAKFNQFIIQGGISLEEYNSIVDALAELQSAVMTKMYMTQLMQGQPLSPGTTE
jgi:hypothetical protein